MPAKSLPAYARVRVPTGFAQYGRIITFGLVAVLAAALFSNPVWRAEPTPQYAIAAAAVGSDESEPAVAPPRFLTAEAATKDAIDALARVVARRYRISQNATREMIAAAYREGKRNGLDPLLIVAVMAVESRFNPIAESDMGAMGLMQIMPRYHTDKLDAANAGTVLDPATNIELGARVLKDYIRRSGSQTAGLQLYNGSPDDESTAYANKVLSEKERLREALARVRNQV